MVELINNGEHLTTQGFTKIISLRASMNKGLNEELSKAFPNTIPVNRPLVENTLIPDPHWLAGFIEGDGCFNCQLKKGGNGRTLVVLRFMLSQHTRDIELMKSINEYFGGGSLNKDGWGSVVNLTISKLSNICNIIIPCLTQYSLQGSKRSNFEAFSEIAKLMENNQHLTTEGLEKIIQIKSKLNNR